MNVTTKLGITLVAVAGAGSFGLPLVDYQIAKWFGRPWFSLYQGFYKDGGSKVYAGLGYRVVCYHRRVSGSPPRRETGVGIDHNFLPLHFKATQIADSPGEKPLKIKQVNTRGASD